LSQDRNNDEEKTVHYESGVAIFSPPPKDQDAEQRAERKAARTYEGRQISIQRNMLWTQIGLVAFGLLGTGTGLWQARISQISSDTSDKAVLLAQKSERDSRKSGEDQARQTAKALNTTIENFQFDERPWVIIGTVGQVTDIPGYQIGGTVINVGRSPAFHLRTISKFTMQRLNDPEPAFEFSVKEAGVPSTLGSQKDFALLLEKGLSQPQVDQMNTEGWASYWGAEVWYEDYWHHPFSVKTCRLYMPSIKKWRERNSDSCKEK
jgi:hypothetical protein